MKIQINPLSHFTYNFFYFSFGRQIESMYNELMTVKRNLVSLLFNCVLTNLKVMHYVGFLSSCNKVKKRKIQLEQKPEWIIIVFCIGSTLKLRSFNIFLFLYNKPNPFKFVHLTTFFIVQCNQSQSVAFSYVHSSQERKNTFEMVK